MTAIFAVIVSIVSNFDKIGIPLWGKVGFIGLLLLTAYLLSVFLKNEFENRVFAAEMVRVVGELLAKLSNPEFKINAAEMDCRKYQSEINGVEYVFPLVFCDHLDNKKNGDCEYFKKAKMRSKFFTSYNIFTMLIIIWTLAIAIVILLLPSP